MSHNRTFDYFTLVDCSPDDYGWYRDCHLWAIWIEDHMNLKLYDDFNLTCKTGTPADSAILSFVNNDHLFLFQLIEPNYRAMYSYNSPTPRTIII